MPGVEDVKLHIAASVDDAERAVTGIRAAVEQLDEALSRLRTATTGSMHPRVTDAIGQFELARQKLDEAQLLTLAGVEAAQTYRAVL
jgi:hypothetical protein